MAQPPAEFARREDYMLQLFAAYLLAQFREKRAFGPLIRIISAPGEIPFDLFGDTVTERLNAILASVYGGDPTPLHQLVEDGEVNEYVRGAALEAFLVLAFTGQMPREEVAGYFKNLFQGRLKRDFNHVWNDLACAVGDLPAPELLDDLQQAFADGLVDGGFADFEFIERCAHQPVDQRRARLVRQHQLIDDTVSEMEWWAAFHQQKPARRSKKPTLGFPTAVSPAGPPSPGLVERVPERVDVKPKPPVVHEPKVGRNDPCPCGSGKKYKKCCLRKS